VGEAWNGPEPSNIFAPRACLLLAKSDPKLLVSSPAFGDAGRRVGANASLSLPTGDTARLVVSPRSVVLECRRVLASEPDVAESIRVTSEGVVDSMVSEAIRGDERVR
jgi:hypothetical protein